MATLDLSQLQQAIDLGNPDAVNFGAFVASAPSLWQWTTPTGNFIDIAGSGMTFSGGHATGGTVSAIGFDVGNNGPAVTEIQIFGFSIAATLLDNSALSFWRVMEGNDTIIGATATATAGLADVVTLFGDNIAVRPGVIKGGDDVIGSGTARTVICGDVVDVGSDAPGAPAANYTGGADTINCALSTFRQEIYGDARTVHASRRLAGGNDVINFTDAGFGSALYGDVQTVNGVAGDLAVFIGGNDTIDAHLSVTDFLTIEGDIGNAGQFATIRGGNDTLIGGAGRDTIVGDVHNQTGDIVCGNDRIDGGAGDDDLVGDVHNAGDGRIICGNDIIRGGDGADGIIGDAANLSSGTVQVGGDDRLFGDAGNDFIIGRTGNDILVGGEGDDSLDGGDGIDTASYATALAGVRADLQAPRTNTGDALGDSYASIEVLIGSGFSDTLHGGAGNESIAGARGGDGLSGRSGNDKLFGGLGSDRMAGGAGRDAFVFDSALNSITNHDTIVDFVAADDTVRLDHRIFTALGQTSGTLAAATFFASATGLAHDASDRIVYNTSTGILSYDADGNGAGAAVRFALLTGAPAITNADFLVI